MKKENKGLRLHMGALLRGYMVFPAIFGGILLAVTIVLFFVYIPTGLVAAAAFLLYMLALVVFYFGTPAYLRGISWHLFTWRDQRRQPSCLFHHLLKGI